MSCLAILMGRRVFCSNMERISAVSSCNGVVITRLMKKITRGNQAHA